MRRDVQKDIGKKARQFVVRAPVRFIRDSAGQGLAMRRAIWITPAAEALMPIRKS